MKTVVLSLMMMFLMGTMTLVAQEKNEKIKVYGKCEMCQNRIEKTVKGIDGVKTANWNIDTKMLSVTFDSKKTSDEAIEKAVASVGHDTDKFRADDKTYEALPPCCHYDRPAPLKKK